MSKNDANSGLPSAAVASSVDSSKLLSLLALAAGAAAMPQSTNADVIFTDLSTNPVSISTNANLSFIITNLPGTARVWFQTNKRATLISSTRVVSVRQNAGYVRLKTHSFPSQVGINAFVVPVGAGVTWNQVVGVTSASGALAKANALGHFPNGFDKQYFVFRFKDSTQVGSPLLYGWINFSVAYPGSGKYPEVTIFGYAYDSTGAFLATGVSTVPEPAPVALLALGALTLGAKGLRSWRRHRPQSGSRDTK